MSKGTDFILKVSGNTLSQVLLPDRDCLAVQTREGPKKAPFLAGRPGKPCTFSKFLKENYSEWNENTKAKDG